MIQAFASCLPKTSEAGLQGYFGVTQPVGDGVFEMKLDFGPGYRVYYAISGRKIIFLLGGGTKDRQQADIDQARSLWQRHKVAL
ncbi:type II toxin-antitoxin system RelE/ParE family toxin [Pseudomonas putida]|uniref:type II toxin-antitoxin system RelE/ParE family toxin n=1 Tax=Pseudomonas putida TaxID=303 RepID=UPI00383AD499